jgi:aspartate aminotransferase-like enzyme
MPSPMRDESCFNMSCGQTALSPSCLEALGEQLDTPLYYLPYWKIEAETIAMLRDLLHASGDVLLITGTATYGLEAVMITVLEPGDKILTVNTGVFGQLLTELATVTGGRPNEIWVERGQVVDPEAIREQLRADPSIKMVAVVAVETSMGTTNPIREIGEVMREFPGVLLMVDAVSAAGAIDVRVDEWGIDFCCTSSQKTLNAPQGVAIVTVSEKGWRAIAARKSPIPTVSLDLTVWRSYHEIPKRSLAGKPSTYLELASLAQSGDTSVPKFKVVHGPSPSYVVIKGLHGALKDLMAEGPELAIHRHRVAGRALRAGVRAMGFEVLAEEAAAAPNCTVVLLPGETCEVRTISDKWCGNTASPSPWVRPVETSWDTWGFVWAPWALWQTKGMLLVFYRRSRKC